ncbi:hypothetical protein [Gemmatimonas sp.]|uniref:hypothetical protein n=1 Tax=Gemmatimonas sp. TaxID=1962908 RepID=UPI00286D7A54|nr:hypothetical protein [Gemmatimonas sp.]
MSHPSRKYNPNDPQRERVYIAERCVDFPRAPEFQSLSEIRAFAQQVLRSPTWEALSRHTLQDGRGVVVKLGRGRRAVAHNRLVGDPAIILPRASWRRWTIFHELAHCARGKLTANHGPQFTASYFRLIHDCWNPDLAHRLQSEFERMRVRVAPWAPIGHEVPKPDPTSVGVSRDEGADLPTEIAQRARDVTYQKAMVAFWRKVRAGAFKTK